jgi:hypothetical protein
VVAEIFAKCALVVLEVLHETLPVPEHLAGLGIEVVEQVDGIVVVEVRTSIVVDKRARMIVVQVGLEPELEVVVSLFEPSWQPLPPPSSSSFAQLVQ